MHPVVLLYYISPFGFLALLPVAVRLSSPPPSSPPGLSSSAARCLHALALPAHPSPPFPLLPPQLAVEASSLADYLAGSTHEHMVVVAALAGVGGLASCFLLITEMQARCGAAHSNSTGRA
jgi:hypothetical protein